MTDTTPAAVAAAIETLVARLEHDHQWLTELRADAEQTEHGCQRLLAAVESALGALPPPDRRPFYIRVMRMRNETPRMGRPPRDGRQTAVLEFLAERGEGPVTNAELRAHLDQHGLTGGAAYVGTLLCALQREEIVTRLSQGRYAINTNHPRLRTLRWRKVARAEFDVLKAEGKILRRQLLGE